MRRLRISALQTLLQRSRAGSAAGFATVRAGSAKYGRVGRNETKSHFTFTSASDLLSARAVVDAGPGHQTRLRAGRQCSSPRLPRRRDALQWCRPITTGTSASGDAAGQAHTSSDPASHPQQPSTPEHVQTLAVLLCILTPERFTIVPRDNITPGLLCTVPPAHFSASWPVTWSARSWAKQSSATCPGIAPGSAGDEAHRASVVVGAGLKPAPPARP